MRRLLRPFVDPRTYRAVAFYVAQLVLGVIGFTLLLAGWPITLVFCITPLVVPLLIGLRVGVGLLAQAQAGAARGLLGVEVQTPVSTEGTGFWSRGFNVLGDPMFWKQQAHLLLAWPTALVPMAIFYEAGELITTPIWARWMEGYEAWWIEVDSFAEALPFTAAGLVLLVVAVHLLGPYARFSRWLALRLLSGDPGPVRSPAEIRARRLRALTVDAIVSTSIVAVLVVIWWLTTPDGYFWPIWPLLALTLVIAVPGWVVFVLENPDVVRIALGSRALAIQVGCSAVLLGFLVGVWAVTTGGYFWPIWPALGLALLAAVHAAVVYGKHAHKVEQLEESRAAAVDVQESELLRIERDLHDGAQARLVALGMSLGMAEEKLRTDPEEAQVLLAEARTGAREALQELRDLARGIRPPILTDRGLEAAIAALVARSPIRVSLSVNVPERPPAAVETAAYFVVAEALANAIKHASASRIDIRIWSSTNRLVTEIVDDGRGGADPAGGGLAGLGQRVAALEGTFHVESPDGGPTTVLAELPCG